MTRDLLQLADWLRDRGVKHVAMEATGVYWKPVWNILEGEFEVVLVNAQHIKRVPGRKTDVKDCEWIAELLQHGLVQASFVPPAEVRELRDLTRYRATLVEEGARVVNRIEKVLEDANLKLASVVTDILGVSGRAILTSIVRGEEDPERLAEMARCRLRAKLPALREALRGRVTEHPRFLLRRLLEHVRFVESEIAKLEERIAEQMRPFQKEVELWSSMPGSIRWPRGVCGLQVIDCANQSDFEDKQQRIGDGEPESQSAALPESESKIAGWQTRKEGAR